MTVPTPPNVSGWTVLRDTSPFTNWTPPMSPNTDYVLLPAVGQTRPRDHQIILQGGRNIYMLGFHQTRGDTDGGPCIMLDGRDNPGTVFMHGCLMDASGNKETDGIRTRPSVIKPDSGSGLTNLTMLSCRIIDNRGQTNPRPGKNGNTTINAAMTAGQTSIVVADIGQITTPCTVIVDSEVMTFTGTSGSTLNGGTRGVNGTTAASHSNGAALQMTDDFGNPTSGTHADCIQLAGGLGKFNAAYSTFHSRYSCLQLQQEQTETGAYGTIVAISRVGSTATARMSANHGLNVGDFVQIGNGVASGGQDCSPTGWNGTYMVASVPASDTLTYDLGDRAPSAISNLGAGPTWKKSSKPYVVGDIDLDHVNLICDENDQQFFSQAPAETTNVLRMGGRPDYKGYEDQTPMVRDAWASQAFLNEVYLQLRSGGLGASGVLNPGSSGSTYSGVRGQLVANAWTYPLWNAINGQITVGAPANGDFCPSWLPGLRFPGARRRRAV